MVNSSLCIYQKEKEIEQLTEILITKERLIEK